MQIESDRKHYSQKPHERKKITAAWFQKRLLTWFHTAGRHHLPWKISHCPYSIWVSEIMLQQTQVTTVIPYFEKFITRFPNVETLAQASLDQVLHAWSGLGYYARARNLHRTAHIIHETYQNTFPKTVQGLALLPGIGRSTAGAILAQAFDHPAPILDANVKRILCRLHEIKGWPGNKVIETQLWALSTEYTPSKSVADYTQAIMDLGALCCTARNPNCHACPLQSRCSAYRNQTQTLYPHPKPKKEKPTKKIVVLLLYNDFHILLEQRPPKGIWGGLWSLPEFDSIKHLKAYLHTKNTPAVQTLKKLPLFRHTFTHFQMHIQPIFCNLGKQRVHSHQTLHPARWINNGELPQCGLPAPIKKILLYAKEELNA